MVNQVIVVTEPERQDNLEIVIMWYLTIASTVFVYWLGLFMSDNSTPKNHLDSWLVLLIAPWFWPIVVPMSIWELVGKAAKKQDLSQESF